jgi:hypothetical protein
VAVRAVVVMVEVVRVAAVTVEGAMVMAVARGGHAARCPVRAAAAAAR